MIISASRRTDIPAFFCDWFFDKIQKGFCEVRNPYNPNQISKISLKPDDVDAIVFWTKNPAPIMPRLKELDKQGFRYYFQFTLNGYSREIEACTPPIEERLDVFCLLSEMLGPRRVVWRYDPIIISNKTDHEFHLRTFTDVCRKLEGRTVRVMTSLAEYYRKTERQIAKIRGYEFDKDAAKKPETFSLLEQMAKTARSAGMELFSCAQERDYSDIGIKPGACVDARLINEIWGTNLSATKDKGQRKFCQCSVSRDIGTNGTCLGACAYCYAGFVTKTG